jgi:hypothetical protein
MRSYKIGRGEGNDIVLADKTISRRHAELEERGGGRFRLKDLGSSLGTKMLQGEHWIAVTEAEVQHDTRIRFGEYETTPMDLVRDTDKTVVNPRATAAARTPARPPSPPPAGSARPAKSAPAAASAPQKFWLLLGAGLAAVVVLVALLLAIVLSDDAATVRPERPDSPRTDEPRRDQAAGAQKFLQTCLERWRGPQQQCECFVRTVGGILQPSDYDDMIEVVTAVLGKNNDRVRDLMQQVTQRRGKAAQTRMVQAGQAMDRECPAR